MNDAPVVLTMTEALRALDRTLQQAVAIGVESFGSGAVDESLRGLVIAPRDLARLFEQSPGAPQYASDDDTLFHVLERQPQLAWLAHSNDLEPFELAVLLLALAPEIDLKYERIFAFLHDDVTRKEPSVGLALDLWCRSAEEKLEARHRFGPDAPLRGRHLVRVEPPANRTDAPLHAQRLRLDPAVLRFLTGDHGLPDHLAPFCARIEPLEPRAEDEPIAPLVAELAALSKTARTSGEALGLHILAPTRSDARRAAAEIARELRLPILHIDLARAPAGADVDELLRVAGLHGALPVLDGVDVVANDPNWSRDVARALRLDRGLSILTGPLDGLPFPPAREPRPTIVARRIEFPTFEARLDAWTRALAEHRIETDRSHVRDVATRFSLDRDQIEAAGATLGACRASRPASKEDLFEAARSLARRELSGLSTFIPAKASWDDIVLRPVAEEQLRSIARAVEHRHEVLDKWGFAKKLTTGKGVSAMFSGPPGTGKTLAAEVLATHLGMDLHKVELAAVVSKYIGETEKNLERIFRSIEGSSSVLFFDEADALFGRRSEVRDAHDRYANLEISYILQRIERFDGGLCILATNLPKNIDTAFTRRIAFSVHFPFPNEQERRAIWEGIWPQGADLAEGLPFDTISRRFALSGGNIKNIALAASYLAVEARGPVTTDLLLRSIRDEFRKIGRQLSDTDLDLSSS